MNYKVIGCLAAAGVLVVTQSFLSFVISQSWNERAVSLCILMAGVAVGWLLGMLVSPYDHREQQRFSAYTRAIATFASGYLAAKMDKLVERIFMPEVLSDPVATFRIMSFASVAIVAMIIAFVFRTYVGVATVND